MSSSSIVPSEEDLERGGGAVLRCAQWLRGNTCSAIRLETVRRVWGAGRGTRDTTATALPFWRAGRWASSALVCKSEHLAGSEVRSFSAQLRVFPVPGQIEELESFAVPTPQGSKLRKRLMVPVVGLDSLDLSEQSGSSSWSFWMETTGALELTHLESFPKPTIGAETQ